jgi:hypothetical protein
MSHKSLPQEWKEIRGAPCKPVKIEPLLEPIRKDHMDKRIDELTIVFDKLEGRVNKVNSGFQGIKRASETLSWIKK